jgi:hypothetical protein
MDSKQPLLMDQVRECLRYKHYSFRNIKITLNMTRGRGCPRYLAYNRMPPHLRINPILNTSITKKPYSLRKITCLNLKQTLFKPLIFKLKTLFTGLCLEIRTPRPYN